MKPLHAPSPSVFRTSLLALGLSAAILALEPAQAASVALATSPLATSTTSTVKPNLMFIIDDSGSMTWTFMPDAANDFHGNVGYQSSQCNGVYYNPDITYQPPLDSSGTSYAPATFTAAHDDGFDSSSSTRNLNSGFIANRFSPESANTTYNNWKSYLNNSGADSLGPYGAVYYAYSGSETQKNYNDSSSTFYTECNTAIGSTILFSKRRLASSETTTINVSGTNSTSVSSITVNGIELMSGASTPSTSSSTVATNIAAQISLNGFSASASGSTVTISGPVSAANYTPVITQSGSMTLTPDVFPDTTAANLTNFANWYSYYRTRLLMMKTTTGRAFTNLNNTYRIGLMKISQTAPVVYVDTFETTHRDDWYTQLYGVPPSGLTPLRRSLSDAGRYFAGKLGGTDPVQYSCQQNFTILSTDGYWNSSAGYQVDGSAAVGNQDGTAARPMYDGATVLTTFTNTYTRNSYSKVTAGCGSGKKLKTTPQTGSCTVATSGASCTPGSWVNGTATTGTTCNSTPAPSPSTPVLQSSVASTSGGSSDSLSDVAMYYYQTDLRTTALSNCTGALGGTVDVCTNNVFIGGNDTNVQQHMTTFTLGLGASGLMNYSSSYLSDNSGDYIDVKLGSTASATVCTWQTSGTVCDWPIPGSGAENIDDLWHAAVDGRGAYFSATNPSSLASGLSNALAGINARKGAAAAAATSTLNPVAGNNYAFVASYTTVAWKGNLEARGINTDTGVVSENATWCVENVVAGTCPAPGTIVAETAGDTTIYNCVTPDSVICTGGVLVGTDCKVQVATSCTGTMNTKVADTSDTRSIKTANATGTALIDFTYANLSPTQQSYFATAHIDGLSQWTTMSGPQRTAAEGANLVNFLRGQYSYEDRTSNPAADRLYRYREAVLGDALESQPAFMGPPVFSYPYPGYSAYRTAQASRAGTVYMGANDGMMHAFAADTGIERWGYVPSTVIPNMWRLADTNYATLHTNYVNGSPVTSDVCTANCTDAATAVWKTILVAGLSGGGRGYYALDITNPAVPALMWELTTTAGIGVVQDDDVGYSFGHPIITRKEDGTWVVLVTSGYNNTSPGDGKGYLYVLDAASGAILSKISTGVGTTTTPSGFSHITGWNNEPAGNLVGFVYGGDLLGNLWRFDINSTATATIGTGGVLQFATLFSNAVGTSPQPITTAPTLGKIAGKRVVFIGTGKYLETSDLTTTQVQSIYAIKDDDATSTFTNPRNSLVNQTVTNNPDGTATRLSSGNTVNFYSGRGWYVDLPDSGERVNIDSELVQGTLIVPTIVPSNTVCSPGGYGWLNFFDYKTGGAVDVSTNLSSVKYDATIVGVNVFYIDSTPKVAVVTSTNPTPDLENAVNFNVNAAGFTGKRVIWRELIP